jgi:hypothetical protein
MAFAFVGNSRCDWVLEFAGCGWRHKTLFYRPARLREKPKEPMIGNI